MNVVVKPPTGKINISDLPCNRLAQIVDETNKIYKGVVVVRPGGYKMAISLDGKSVWSWEPPNVGGDDQIIPLKVCLLEEGTEITFTI